jgi:NAD(P)-dependent dehydrogenase (short-subunit alcohol dehydrogenase family)
MGQAVLITGGAQRLGRAIALHFAREGFDIAIHYRSSNDAARALADEVRALGRRARAYRADLEKPDETDALIPSVLHDFPHLVGLIHSASTFERDRFGGITRDFLTRQHRVNAEATLFLTQALWNAIDGPGWVINLIDAKIDQITPAFFSYTLSKLALEDVTRMTARACAPKLRVNAVAPGLVLRSGKQTDAEFEAAHHDNPLGRGPDPEDIARMAFALAAAESVTGQIVAVDGGSSFYSPKSAGML